MSVRWYKDHISVTFKQSFISACKSSRTPQLLDFKTEEEINYYDDTTEPISTTFNTIHEHV